MVMNEAIRSFPILERCGPLNPMLQRMTRVIAGKPDDPSPIVALVIPFEERPLLDAALDAKAPSYWGGAEAPAPTWPEGAQPLAPLVKAPPALAARLSHVAVVARADGDRLQAALKPGMRLVSKEGDLWRWDGFVARADAPKPAAVRLEQRTRLAEVEAEIDLMTPRAEATAAAHDPAAGFLARPSPADAAERGAHVPPVGGLRNLDVALALGHHDRDGEGVDRRACHVVRLPARIEVDRGERVDRHGSARGHDVIPDRDARNDVNDPIFE